MSLSPSPSTISSQEMLQDTGRLLADVAEDLAIEILSEFTKEDYSHLGKTLDRLVAAASANMGNARATGRLDNGRLTYASVRSYVSLIMRAAKADGIPIKARKRGNLATPSRALK